MPKRILVPLWRARGGSAVHPATPVSHRGRLAQAPGPRLGFAAGALVYPRRGRRGSRH